MSPYRESARPLARRWGATRFARLRVRVRRFCLRYAWPLRLYRDLEAELARAIGDREVVLAERQARIASEAERERALLVGAIRRATEGWDLAPIHVASVREKNAYSCECKDGPTQTCNQTKPHDV